MGKVLIKRWLQERKDGYKSVEGAVATSSAARQSGGVCAVNGGVNRAP